MIDPLDSLCTSTTTLLFLAKPGIYLEDLFVLEDKRGLGIGSALLRHLAMLCVSNDWGRLEWSVLDWNESAIRVYERLGAKSMKEWNHVQTGWS